VTWADGSAPLSLEEIQSAWHQTGLPSIQDKWNGGMAPNAQQVWDGNGMLYTHEGGVWVKGYSNPASMYGDFIQHPATGQWSYVPDGSTAPAQMPAMRPVEFLYSFDYGGKSMAFNLTTGEKVAQMAVVTRTSASEAAQIEAVAGIMGPESTKWHWLPGQQGGVPQWAYGVKEYPTFTRVTIAQKPLTREGCVEAIRDAIARYGDRGAIHLQLQSEKSLYAAARMHVTGELPDSMVLEKFGGEWPEGHYDPSFRQVLTDDDLAMLMPRRPNLPDPAPDSLEGTPGTPEHLTDALESEWMRRIRSATGPLRGKLVEGWETWKNPVPFKQLQQDRLIRSLTKEWFPDILEADMPKVWDLYREQLGVPKSELVDYILEDRALLDRWVETRSMADFERLVAHADKYGISAKDAREQLDTLYESPDWQMTVELMNWTARSAGTEAFGVHFFNSYRSTFERSINHPLLGVYPASWAYKVAKEWFRFLYKNHTFGFNLGMQPARAISNITWAQQEATAQNGEDLADWYDNGPISSPIFIFNLLMPGDWSNIPFPLSRSLRDLLRGNTNPLSHIENNLWHMGLGRDARLTWEVGNEWWNLATNKQAPRRENEKTLDPAMPR
jgi:hypothetical protein